MRMTENHENVVQLHEVPQKIYNVMIDNNCKDNFNIPTSVMVITPEDDVKYCDTNKSVFLAGTIDNGDSVNWQKETINELLNLNVKDLDVYNPRREHWNSNAGADELERQIKWEQYHLDKADVIAMVLLDDSKSPISLLEFGLYSTSNKLIVFCTPNFYRFDNVRLTCEKYGIELVQDLTPKVIAEKIYQKL